jgi:hypothetical protein
MSVEPSLIERLDPEKSALGATFASILIPALNSLYFDARTQKTGSNPMRVGNRLRLRMSRILDHAGIPFRSIDDD